MVLDKIGNLLAENRTSPTNQISSYNSFFKAGGSVVTTRTRANMRLNIVISFLAVVLLVSVKAANKDGADGTQEQHGIQAKAYEDQAIVYRTKSKFDSAGHSFRHAARYYKEQGNIKKRAEMNEKAAESFKDAGLHEWTASLYFNAAKIYNELGNSNKEADLYVASGQAYKSAGLHGRAAGMYFIAARIYGRLGDSKAAETYEATASSYSSAGNHEMAASMYSIAATTYQTQGSTGKAIEMYRAAASSYRANKDQKNASWMIECAVNLED